MTVAYAYRRIIISCYHEIYNIIIVQNIIKPASFYQCR